MGALRPLVLLVALLVLAGTVFHLTRAPGPEPERADPTAGPWGRAEHPAGFTLPLPHAWLRNPQAVPGHGMSFLGPEVDGFRPHVVLYWRPTKRAPDEWIADRVDRVAGTVRGSAATTLAGGRARLVVYDTERRNRSVRVMDWYFGRDGHGGILRAVAPLAEHGSVYRPFFLRIARGLRSGSR